MTSKDPKLQHPGSELKSCPWISQTSRTSWPWTVLVCKTLRYTFTVGLKVIIAQIPHWIMLQIYGFVINNRLFLKVPVFFLYCWRVFIIEAFIAIFLQTHRTLFVHNRRIAPLVSFHAISSHGNWKSQEKTHKSTIRAVANMIQLFYLNYYEVLYYYARHWLKCTLLY